MIRKFWCFVLLFVLCICGCEYSSDENDEYDDMVSDYELFTVAGLWEAFENDEDYNGAYILVEGVLHSVGYDLVILIDDDTDTTIECEFDSSIDLTDLEDALDNDDDQVVVTVGGICYYYDDDSSYPYLAYCDYYYINSDE